MSSTLHKAMPPLPPFASIFEGEKTFALFSSFLKHPTRHVVRERGKREIDRERKGGFSESEREKER